VHKNQIAIWVIIFKDVCAL